MISPSARRRIALAVFLKLALDGLLASLSGAQTPAESAAAAAADAATIPPAQRISIQYVALDGLSPEQAEDATAAVNYALNAVARTATIARAARVPRTTLLRWDWATYATTPEELRSLLQAREAMGVADPYYRLTTQVLGADGKPKTTVVLAGWANPQAQTTLYQYTGSYASLQRADRFVARATQPPAYYALAGVPEKQADLYSYLGLDESAQARLQAVGGANMVRSDVTFKPRKIARFAAPSGSVWVTFDHADGGDAAKDPIRYPLRQVRRPNGATDTVYAFDATEIRALKANGFFLDALYDAAGVRQDAVPDRIARDTSEPAATDGRLVPMISCVRCHVEDGVRPFSNATGALIEAGVAIESDLPENAQRAIAFYTHPRTLPSAQRDRQDHAAAVQAATGRPVKSAIAAVAGTVRRYSYDLVTPAQAALELGTTREVLQTAARASADPILKLLSAGHPVDRGQWESSYQEAAIRTAPFRHR